MATTFHKLTNSISKNKTIFEKCLQTNFEVSFKVKFSPEDFDHVLHIGYSQDFGDVFKAWKNGHEAAYFIYFGIAGDEFK